jgi:hypothetical protein
VWYHSQVNIIQPSRYQLPPEDCQAIATLVQFLNIMFVPEASQPKKYNYQWEAWGFVLTSLYVTDCHLLWIYISAKPAGQLYWQRISSKSCKCGILKVNYIVQPSVVTGPYLVLLSVTLIVQIHHGIITFRINIFMINMHILLLTENTVWKYILLPLCCWNRGLRAAWIVNISDSLNWTWIYLS